ncbi:MAG: hypothetical protein CM15mP109_07390 [Candidatus Dadabacteria bacterium]|nr:MAG: hypothetical protein CM15mP109_07390 [Candidatus Dadabacteria bacterium]
MVDIILIGILNSIGKKYLKAMEELPIDYIEIGYRNLKQSEYKGEFFIHHWKL